MIDPSARNRRRWPGLRYVPSRRELETATLDLRARLAGYCDHAPRRSSTVGGGGGYLFWRCALRRGHDGLHGSGSYVWDATGDVEYRPAPGSPRQRNELARPLTPSYAQRLRADNHWRAKLPTEYGWRSVQLDARDWLDARRSDLDVALAHALPHGVVQAAAIRLVVQTTDRDEPVAAVRALDSIRRWARRDLRVQRAGPADWPAA